MYKKDCVYYFITLAVKNRAEVFNDEGYSYIIMDSIKYYCNKYKLLIEGYVVMRDHLHLLVGLPIESQGEQPLLRADIMARGNGPSPGLNPIIKSFLYDFKGYTGFNIIKQMKQNHNQNLKLLTLSKSGINCNYFRLWQKNWYIKIINNEKQYYQTIQYIKNNPVEAELFNLQKK
ncbi:MAG: transposase [Patescibacteria group bacterium]